MRLNSLLGLGLAKADKEPKRQKRSDVLDSLGLGTKAPQAPKKDPGAKCSPDEEMRRWLQDEVAPEEGKADGVEPAHSSEQTPERLPEWQLAFAKAKDRWDSTGERCFYHHSENNLYFEWDQGAGLLFQYFVEEVASNQRLPERAPIWSAECPETHAEVWEVLPLPPTDPNAQ
ncbi:unnamed protein product, partial [Durusdinium trenchii]